MFCSYSKTNNIDLSIGIKGISSILEKERKICGIMPETQRTLNQNEEIKRQKWNTNIKPQNQREMTSLRPKQGTIFRV